MIAPTDPVPPLPRFHHGQRAVVVDAKESELVAMWLGRKGRISWPNGARDRGQQPRFVPDGDHRTYPVDTPRHRGRLIVEPVTL